jgi:hypothetical protein
VVPVVRTFYYRAYDQAGHKRTGTIEARDQWTADKELRKGGLRPYFLHDYQKLKRILRQKQKKRQRVIAIAGASAVALSIVVSIVIVRLAGRERALTLDDYKLTGRVVGQEGGVVAATDDEEEFALEMYRIWDSFCPRAVVGLEVTKLLMTIHVTRNIRNLSEDELELLASNTVRALQRRFGTTGCTLVVVEDTTPIMDASYSIITKRVRVKSYR